MMKLLNRWNQIARGASQRDIAPRHSYKDMDRLSALRCVIAYNRHGGYCLPESALHRPAAQAILSGNVHEPHTIEYMATHCRNLDIVHAGTFFGDFLPALSHAIDASASIWAFEPNRENYRCARITLELNEISNVRLMHAGLGARKQRLFVQTSDANGRSLGGGSKIVGGGPGAQNHQPVEIVAIDQIIPSDRVVGILQLDVEGYEKEALTGALNTIRRCRPILILEALAESQLERDRWFAENVLNLGYKFVTKLHANSVYSCE